MNALRAPILLAFLLPVTTQAGGLRLANLRPFGEFTPVGLRAIGLAHGRDGQIWAYSLDDLRNRRARMYFLRGGSGQVREAPVDFLAAGIREAAEIIPNLAIDSAGRACFPVMWREGRQVGAAIVRLAENGATTAVVLDSMVEPRHIAFREDGSFVVLGIDAGFFRGREDRCELLHVYSSDGRRLRSFSACPDHGQAGASPARRNGVDFELLKPDVDHGQLWLAGDRIHQVLPATRELRVFSASGEPAGVVRFPPPEGLGGQVSIRKLFSLAGGRFLVAWMSQQRTPEGLRGATVAVLHGADGRIASRPARGEDFGGLIPFAVTERGELVCWRQEGASGRRTLWLADLTTESGGEQASGPQRN